jgi:cytidine deaminase
MADIAYIKNLAQKKAIQSGCRYRIAAVGLDKRGNVIGSTTNRVRFVNKGGGIHAEIALIEKYGKRIKSIFICRVNAQGELLNIKPCENCQSVANKLGIKIYSIARN